MTVQESKQKKPSIAANELLSKTFTLLSPIHVGDEVIKTITITEPLARQQTMAEREEKAHGHIFTALLLQISDLPKKALEDLKIRDVGQIKHWLNALNGKALADDGLSLPKPAEEEVINDPFADDPRSVEPLEEIEGERLFKLSVPVNYDGRTITELNVCEPNLKAVTASERFKEETAQITAMVAVMANETIPIISRITQRDMHRIEVWMVPFMRNLQLEVAG